MPQPTAVFQVEGILRKPVGGQPLDSGRRLYHGLASMYSLVLVTESTDRQQIKTWLAMEGFDKHAHIIHDMDTGVAGTGIWWLTTANMLRNNHGYNIEYFVLNDPEAASYLIKYGYSTLLVTNAAYALPEWRPDADKGVTAWADLAAEIDRQRTLRAADKRMEEHI